MKRIIVFIVSVLFFVPMYSQFQLSHGTEKNEVGNSVRTLHFDEAYIIGGLTDFPFFANHGVDATLLKTRYDGSIMWANVYGTRGNEVFNSVRPIYPKDDKGYACLGVTNNSGLGGDDMMYVLTDPFGNPTSAYVYGGKESDEGQCIQLVKDPNTDEPLVIMIGHTKSYTCDSKMFIVKTRLDGSFIDGVIVGYIGNQYGYWIEQTKDGGFIAVGSNDYACGVNDVTKPNHDIFVVKLKPNLDLEWARTIGGGEKVPLKDIAFSVKEIEEGYIITGQTYSFGENKTNDAFLLKLDHGGGFIWLRNYGYTSSDGAYDVLSEEFSSINHQYILNGYTRVNNSTYGLLLATNYDGNVMWAKGYGWEGYQTGYEMDKTLNPGYVFTGLETSFGVGQRSIYQVVTNDIGDSNCPQCEIEPPIKTRKHEPCINDKAFLEHIETGKKFELEHREVEYKTVKCGTKNKTTGSNSGIDLDDLKEDKLVLFPNPAKEIVKVQYPESYQHGSLRVYNNTGKLVLSKTLSESISMDISLENLGSGIYMISIVSRSGELLSTNLVIPE